MRGAQTLMQGSRLVLTEWRKKPTKNVNASTILAIVRCKILGS